MLDLFALMLRDLSGEKKVNDNFGHATTNAERDVLQTAGGVLTAIGDSAVNSDVTGSD